MHNEETDPTKDGVILVGLPSDHSATLATERLLASSNRFGMSAPPSQPHLDIGLIGGRRSRGLASASLLMGLAAMGGGLSLLGGLGGPPERKDKSYTKRDLDNLCDARRKLWKRAEARAQQSGLDLVEVLAQAQFEKLRGAPDWAQQHNLSVRYFDGTEIRWSC